MYDESSRKEAGFDGEQRWWPYESAGAESAPSVDEGSKWVTDKWRTVMNLSYMRIIVGVGERQKVVLFVVKRFLPSLFLLLGSKNFNSHGPPVSPLVTPKYMTPRQHVELLHIPNKKYSATALLDAAAKGTANIVRFWSHSSNEHNISLLLSLLKQVFSSSTEACTDRNAINSDELIAAGKFRVDELA
ncbi:hypothetical protein C8R48DRAFT_676398 [Suillus tomentosus]|nr:hypothetical protein C8R48DRAFT_676398 [Suillus tomentosus]